MGGLLVGTARTYPRGRGGGKLHDLLSERYLSINAIASRRRRFLRAARCTPEVCCTSSSIRHVESSEPAPHSFPRHPGSAAFALSRVITGAEHKSAASTHEPLSERRTTPRSVLTARLPPPQCPRGTCRSRPSPDPHSRDAAPAPRGPRPRSPRAAAPLRAAVSMRAGGQRPQAGHHGPPSLLLCAGDEGRGGQGCLPFF